MTTLELSTGDSIQKALSSAPEGPLTLILDEGTWNEKVTVNRPEVTLISECGAVISYSDRHGLERNGHILNTGESATFTVAAPDFQAIGVTFLNSFNWNEGHNWNDEHEDEKIDLQAVALRTVFGAGKSTFRSCTFTSWQDTLYLDYGVSSFEDCTVSGNIDFIFGSASALFQGCEIISRGKGCVTAPSTYAGEEIGFIFHDSSFIHEDIVDDSSVYLARPWFPAGSTNRCPMALFIDCELSGHINPALWTDMATRKPGGEEIIHKPGDARFFITSRDRENITGEKADEVMTHLLQRL